MNPLPSRSLILSSFLAVAAVMTARPAAALECSTDQDCPEGFACEKGMALPGCATPPDCGSQEPTESEIGFCSRVPISCQVDSDCPQYLRCVTTDDTMCWQDSTGDGGCEPPDPNAPKICSYEPIECQADTDCPTGFECKQEQASCPPQACMPGDECVPVPCEPSGKQYCEPKEIACQANADCPQDWSCTAMESDCAVTPVGPGFDGGTQPEPEPCEPLVRNLCSPPGFDSVGDYKESADLAGAPASSPGAAPAEEDGGCSLPARPASGAGASALLLAMAAWLIRSRRR